MINPIPEPAPEDEEFEAETLEEKLEENPKKDERKRRFLLILLLLLLLLCCCSGYFMFRYFTKPQPLPEMVPVIAQNVNYPPSYKLSFPVKKPMGVAVSPDGQRIYVTSAGGDRMIQMFNRDGALIKSFAPPLTNASSRLLTYLAVDASGRVFVTDITNDVIAVFDQDGNFIDGLINQDQTISETITAKTGGGILPGTQFYFSKEQMSAGYQLPGSQDVQLAPIANQDNWSPLGLRFDQKGNLLVTNIVAGKHEVLIYPAEALAGSWSNFNPQVKRFGEEGKLNGQLSFPNSVVTDSKGNFYVSDGNNGRVSTWTPDLKYRTFFGFGSGETALNLPRGEWMDAKDRLYVADAVGQYLRVYDVSGAESVFLFNIGEFGSQDGQFNFPLDICIDGTGRLYIVDRENNRLQVWSY